MGAIFFGFWDFSGGYGRVKVRMLLTWALLGVLFCIGGGLSCPLSGDVVILCVG